MNALGDDETAGVRPGDAGAEAPKSGMVGRRRLIGLGAGAAVAVAFGAAGPVRAEGRADRAGTETLDGTSRTDVIIEWYDTTAAVIASWGAPTQITNSRAWGIGWLAAARALEYGRDRDFEDAAVASAVHAALRTLFPGTDQAAFLDGAFARTLARLPAGRRTSAGIAEGERQAARAVAEREGDGLRPEQVNAPYTPPPVAPGIWRPTPPDPTKPAVQFGQRLGRTFLLGRADRFRPGPAPGLGSDTYLTHLAEIRAYGRKTGGLRTPEQTDTALFWQQSSLAGFTGALRAAVAHPRPRSVRDRARLVAAFHTISVDAQIAVFEAKYVYTRWRPVTAIREGSVDPDPTWEPLVATPRHPDYPGGHCTFAGAAEAVLTALAGPGPATPVTLGSPDGVTRTYAYWHEMTRDNINARVWEGVHFRYSDLAGATLGRQVAGWGLARLPTLFG
ncbi:vanadium-dependent haloperoxidase [Embleya scabrispora]|uniref:vanadium-dependent haloperoxidase n=1 Tax=Embleya scabrispora TaxID=159449 RepID=UPI0003764FED|nr:vanadium-dependent haloperoxidase [Embleya scabrispora]